MDMTWVFDKGVRNTLGERTLPEWKKWLKDNDVALTPFMEKHYPGNLQEDIQRMRTAQIDEWLFYFVNSPHGLQAARVLTPEHPELAPSEEYDPTEAMIKAGPVRVGSQVLSVKEKQLIEGVDRTPPPPNLFRDGYVKETDVSAMHLTQLSRELRFEVNEREHLFRYMKERKDVDLDTLPSTEVSAGFTLVVMDDEGLRPGILVEFSKDGRIIEEEGARVLDDGGEHVIRLLHAAKDVTGKSMDYGQAEVMRKTHDADCVFVVKADY